MEVGLPDNGNWSNIAPKPLSDNGVNQELNIETYLQARQMKLYSVSLLSQ